MTKQELKGYRAIKKEIAAINQRLAELERSGSCSDTAGKLKEQYRKLHDELIMKEMEINRFIQSIDDAELQWYVRAKYLEGNAAKSDYLISLKLRYHRTTLAKRLAKLLD